MRTPNAAWSQHGAEKRVRRDGMIRDRMKRVGKRLKRTVAITMLGVLLAAAGPAWAQQGPGAAGAPGHGAPAAAQQPRMGPRPPSPAGRPREGR